MRVRDYVSTYFIARLAERQLEAQQRLADTLPNNIERWMRYRPMMLQRYIDQRYNSATKPNAVIGSSKRMGRLK